MNQLLIIIHAYISVVMYMYKKLYAPIKITVHASTVDINYD